MEEATLDNNAMFLTYLPVENRSIKEAELAQKVEKAEHAYVQKELKEKQQDPPTYTVPLAQK